MTDVAADIADMEMALQAAKRPKVRAILSEYLQQLKAEQALRDGSAVPPPESKPAPSKSTTGATSTPGSGSATKPAATPAPASAPGPASASLPDVSAPAKIPVPIKQAPPPPVNSGDEFKAIASFGWDQDSYGTDPNFVSIYITSGVDGVGDIKDRVTCDFTKSAFDLKIMGLGSPPRNYRLLKTNLEKEILPEKSKVIVKKNQIKIKLYKVKGEYGHHQWLDLTQKRPESKSSTDSPGDDLMNMMKDLYDNGDDQMKKTLGEAMLKSRQKQAMGLPDDELNP